MSDDDQRNRQCSQCNSTPKCPPDNLRMSDGAVDLNSPQLVMLEFVEQISCTSVTGHCNDCLTFTQCSDVRAGKSRKCVCYHCHVQRSPSPSSATDVQTWRSDSDWIWTTEVDIVSDSSGQVDVVLVLCHDGQQLVECQDSHPLDVKVGDGGGKMTGADEAEAS